MENSATFIESYLISSILMSFLFGSISAALVIDQIGKLVLNDLMLIGLCWLYIHFRNMNVETLVSL
jgi:hypothetical protein